MEDMMRPSLLINTESPEKKKPAWNSSPKVSKYMPKAIKSPAVKDSLEDFSSAIPAEKPKKKQELLRPTLVINTESEKKNKPTDYGSPKIENS